LILLLAVLTGLAAGLARARLNHRPLQMPEIRRIGLAFIAYLPQYLAFGLSATRRLFSDEIASVFLISSQILLLVFIYWNRRLPGFLLLGAGLALNLIAITANGGLMPISPETVAQIAPSAPPGSWQVRERLGNGKDIVLPAEEMRFPIFADRFVFPAWIFPQVASFRAAFSLGDVLIALGAFWLLWSLGRPAPASSTVSQI